MKLTLKLLVLLFGVLLASAANAESPREQLKQMFDQLQKNPTDDALREKVIKLAQTIKPVPAVPEEAIEFEGRAQFAFKNAKAEGDYLAAAKEYEKAISVAPWVSGYYSDLCTIYEKAGKFEEVKRNCEFSLVGLADSAQITDIKRRIAGLKYGIEQNSPEAIAARKREESAKRGVAGFWQMQSYRTIYSNVDYRKADGVWKETSDPRETRGTYEISKAGDSYEITGLTIPWIPYKTKRADATTIEFGRPDCEGEGKADCDYSHQCALEGEQLLCSVFNWGYRVKGDGYREEERWVRRESCVTGPKDKGGRVTVHCR